MSEVLAVIIICALALGVIVLREGRENVEVSGRAAASPVRDTAAVSRAIS
jgi:hypothetical protein